MNYQIKKPTYHNWLSHQISYKSIIKQAIIKLALYGFIPVGLATWLIQVMGLSHE